MSSHFVYRPLFILEIVFSSTKLKVSLNETTNQKLLETDKMFYLHRLIGTIWIGNETPSYMIIFIILLVVETMYYAYCCTLSCGLGMELAVVYVSICDVGELRTYVSPCNFQKHFFLMTLFQLQICSTIILMSNVNIPLLITVNNKSIIIVKSIMYKLAS